jgi:ribonuclease HI
MEVVVYSDSKYVVDAVEKNGFFNGKKRGLRKKRMSIYGNGFSRCIENIMSDLPGLKDTIITHKMNVAMLLQFKLPRAIT